MNFDKQLGAWQQQWQGTHDETGSASVTDLRRRVETESRRMKIGLLAPAAITVGSGGGVLLRAVGTPQTADLVLAVGVWLSILIAWTGTLAIAFGTWRPLGETTAAYVDVSIRRCRSNIRSAKLGIALYLAQFLFILLWTLFTSPASVMSALWAWPVIVIGWIGFPLFLVWVRWYVRGKRTELAALLDSQMQIDGLP